MKKNTDKKPVDEKHFDGKQVAAPPNKQTSGDKLFDEAIDRLFKPVQTVVK